MKRVGAIIVAVLLMITISACNNTLKETEESSTAEQNVSLHNPEDKVTDWQVALKYLEEGNLRYVNNNTVNRNTEEEDRETLKDGQHPFAVIVTCSDSRVSPEIYFDQKLGNIFEIENAGNIIDETVLGSIEYAVEHLETPLVVVVGHSSCGAVTGTIEGGDYPSNLRTIINKIQSNIGDIEDLDEAIYANIEQGVEQICEDSVVDEMGATVLGAYYNIETGEITWID